MSGLIRLAPYARLQNGDWSIPEAVLRQVWEIMLNEDKKDTVFYGGNMDSFEAFLRYLQSPAILPIVATWGSELAGLAWLSGMSGRHAFAHFCFFKSVSGRRCLEIGRYILGYWFQLENQGKPIFNVLIGITPIDYKTALKYIRALGFQPIGGIPGLCAGAACETGVISYRTRE